MIFPSSVFEGARKSGGGDVRGSPDVRCSHSVGSLSSPPVVAGFEWVRDDILKYKSSITSMASFVALQCQVKYASPEDSCKLAIQACGSDDYVERYAYIVFMSCIF